MKTARFITYISVLVLGCAYALTASCSRGGADYDRDLCRTLSTKIERHDELSQRDYSLMIEQDRQILQYLISCADDIRNTPVEERDHAWRNLTANPDYMERFGYLFTLGSALYQADIDGSLNEDNARKYKALDEYNERLADYAER